MLNSVSVFVMGCK